MCMDWIYIHNRVQENNDEKNNRKMYTPGGQLKPETEQCNDESLMSETCLNYTKITFI